MRKTLGFSTIIVNLRRSKDGTHMFDAKYRYSQIFNIRRTKSQNLNVSPLVLQLSLYNILKSGVKLKMKMQLKQRRQATL